MQSAYTYTNSRGEEWYLHGRLVTLKNGRQQDIYYFAREVRPSEALTEIPSGKTVVETQRTGMPVLKNI